MHVTLAARVAHRYLEAGKYDQSLTLVRQFALKYARILGVTELPKIAIRDNLSSKWLGRCTWRNGHENVMEIQARALVDERTLERIVAHEMAHHAEYLQFTEQDIALIKAGIRPASHGAPWKDLAARINAVAGAGFVTKNSDEDFVLTKETKPYLVLVSKIDSSTLGYAIGVRLSPRMKSFTDRRLAEGAKLIQTTNAIWANGPKIGGGWAVPRQPEEKERLQKLYDTGKG
jgi:hypothetical protein